MVKFKLLRIFSGKKPFGMPKQESNIMLAGTTITSVNADLRMTYVKMSLLWLI
jgi:hypothetical protein